MRRTNLPNSTRIAKYIAFISCGVFLFLAAANFKISKNYERVSLRAIAVKPEENPKEFLNDDAKVKKIFNQEPGLWDRTKTQNIMLIKDLVISDDQDKNKIFSRVSDIAVDSSYNIYVPQGGLGKVQVYDDSGGFLYSIGRLGQGPNELSSSIRIAIKNNILYIFDVKNYRFATYGLEGNLVSVGKLNTFLNAVWGFDVDNYGNFYFSSYKNDDTVIHKYSVEGEHLISFGEPPIFNSKDRIQRLRLKSMFGRGMVSIKNESIYYTQSTPYEINEYMLDGTILKRIFKKNDIVPVSVSTRQLDTYSVKIPITSLGIITTDDFIINCIVNNKLPNSDAKWGTILDFYNFDGELLTTVQLKEKVIFYTSDSKNRLYGRLYNLEDPEAIYRYQIEISSSSRGV